MDAMADTAITYSVTDHPEPQWTLGERIRKCRNLMGLEQEEFGALFGVSGSLVSKWEKDAREPKFSQVKAIEAVAPVPSNFLSRSRCSDVIDLRVIPGGGRTHEVLGQAPLPFLTLIEA